MTMFTEARQRAPTQYHTGSYRHGSSSCCANSFRCSRDRYSPAPCGILSPHPRRSLRPLRATSALGSPLPAGARGGWCRNRTHAGFRPHRFSKPEPYRSANHPTGGMSRSRTCRTHLTPYPISSGAPYRSDIIPFYIPSRTRVLGLSATRGSASLDRSGGESNPNAPASPDTFKSHRASH